MFTTPFITYNTQHRAQACKNNKNMFRNATTLNMQQIAWQYKQVWGCQKENIDKLQLEVCTDTHYNHHLAISCCQWKERFMNL